MPKKMRKTFILAAKIGLAVVLLAWVLHRVHWRDYVQAPDGRTYAVLQRLPAIDANGPRLKVHAGRFRVRDVAVRPAGDFVQVPGGRTVVRPGFLSSLTRLDAGLALAGACLFAVTLLLAAARWRILLGAQKVHVSGWEAVRLTFLGQFFNAVVPGTVGGDLVKAYYVSKHTPRVAAVLVSVFADRLVGLVGLALMASVMLVGVVASGAVPFESLRLAAWSVGAVVLGVSGLVLFLLSGRFRRVTGLEKLFRKLPIAHHIAAAGDALHVYRVQWRRTGAALLLTFSTHLTFVGFIALVGKSLDMPVGWYTYFLYVPLIYIIGAVPLTPGGVGWVENWYVEFFAGPGCGASLVLVLALLARLVPMLWGLPGAVVAVSGARPPKPEAMAAELARKEQEAAS